MLEGHMEPPVERILDSLGGRDKLQAKGTRAFNYNLLSCLFIYAVSFLFLFSTFSIEDTQSRVFPQVICGLSIILVTCFLISVLRGKITDTINLSGTKSVLIMAGLIFLYISAIYLGGYYIATVLYLPIGMIYLGQRNWKTIIGVDLGLNLVIYVFFGLLLSMQMPVGVLF